MGHISFSEYSKFRECKHQWSLLYKHHHRQETPSTWATIGKIGHAFIQEFLQDLHEITDRQVLDRSIVQEYEKSGLTTVEELEEIKEYFAVVFPFIQKYQDPRKDGWKLIGIEKKIYYPLFPESKLNFYGLQDALFARDDELTQFLIHDFKFTNKGWDAWDYKKLSKVSQLLLYTKFISAENDIKPKNVHSEYHIFRKNSAQKEPARGNYYIMEPKYQHTVTSAYEDMIEFAKETHDSDGNKVDSEFPGNSRSCMFCDFKNNLDLCPLNNRK